MLNYMIKFHIPYNPFAPENREFTDMHMPWKLNDLDCINRIDGKELQTHLLKELSKIFGSSGIFFTSSCTHALEAIAMALGISTGDEIIMPSFTYAATANAFLKLGAKPVFADIDLEDMNICPKSTRALISPNTKAIVPIHYGGRLAQIEELEEMLPKGAYIIEDAAHTLGARSSRPIPPANLGTAGAISFHITKNIHSGGRGGIIVCPEPKLAQKLSLIADQGTDRKAFINGAVDAYSWQMQGMDLGMTRAQKIHLLASLYSLDRISAKRRHNCEMYRQGIDKLQMPNPKDTIENGHVFYILAPSGKNVNDVDEFISFMKNNNVDVRRHYYPLHMSTFGSKFAKSSLPNTEDAYQRLIRLPVHHKMTDHNIQAVCELTNKFWKSK